MQRIQRQHHSTNSDPNCCDDIEICLGYTQNFTHSSGTQLQQDRANMEITLDMQQLATNTDLTENQSLSSWQRSTEQGLSSFGFLGAVEQWQTERSLCGVEGGKRRPYQNRPETSEIKRRGKELLPEKGFYSLSLSALFPFESERKCAYRENSSVPLDFILARFLLGSSGVHAQDMRLPLLQGTFVSFSFVLSFFQFVILFLYTFFFDKNVYSTCWHEFQISTFLDIGPVNSLLFSLKDRTRADTWQLSYVQIFILSSKCKATKLYTLNRSSN